MVAIFDDRLEIQNPGPLPFGMTIDELKAGVSKVRNRMIARIMRLLLMMEEWGSGYKRILEACRAGGYPEPEWQELGTVVKIVFRPHPEVEKLINADVPVDRTANTYCNLAQSAAGFGVGKQVVGQNPVDVEH